MKLNYLRFGTTAFVWLLGTTLVAGQQLTDQSEIGLNDLSAFKNAGKTWSIAGGVTANLNEQNALNISKGSGILVNYPKKNTHGEDLLTVAEHGDIVLELDYLLAKGANSGIYLQGVYEIQLEDSWGFKNVTSANNGGIYSRWDDAKPEGQKGYEGHAPRQNASKAPGTWQHIRIAFQAPKFDGSGKKTENARVLSIELNGVTIHDNIELFDVTRGANGPEKALASLRLQGDHGSVAFKNIKISKLDGAAISGRQRGDNTDPIYIDAATTPNIRSFVYIPGGPVVVHAISVSSPQEVHYSYDLDNGALFQGWHGDFIDATPMWDGRGNGSSRARGVLTSFTKKPVPALAKLSDPQAAWLADTTGTGFKPKGYTMDAQDRPVFTYNIYGAKVTDAIRVNENGQGVTREITLDKPTENIYALIGSGSDIQEVAKGLYLLDGQSYYVKFDDAKDKPVIRDANGKKELVVLVRGKLNYSILF